MQRRVGACVAIPRRTPGDSRTAAIVLQHRWRTAIQRAPGPVSCIGLGVTAAPHIASLSKLINPDDDRCRAAGQDLCPCTRRPRHSYRRPFRRRRRDRPQATHQGSGVEERTESPSRLVTSPTGTRLLPTSDGTSTIGTRSSPSLITAARSSVVTGSPTESQSGSRFRPGSREEVPRGQCGADTGHRGRRSLPLLLRRSG